MKKYLPLFFLLWLCATAYGQSDSASAYVYYKPAATPACRNIIKLGPLKLTSSTMSLSYERAISPRSSLMITGLLTSATSNELSYAGYDVSAFGGGGDLEFRNYPLADYVPMKGYFVGVYTSFNHTAFDYKQVSTSYYNANYPAPEDEYITRYGGGITMGYQFLVKQRLAFDLYAGGGIRAVDSKMNNNSYYYN